LTLLSIFNHDFSRLRIHNKSAHITYAFAKKIFIVKAFKSGDKLGFNIGDQIKSFSAFKKNTDEY
jgi:hypothetical protein